MLTRARLLCSAVVACFTLACEPVKSPKDTPCCEIDPESGKCAVEVVVGMPEWEITGVCECELVEGEPECHTGAGLLAC